MKTINTTSINPSIRRITLLVSVVLAGLAAGFFFTYEASVTLGLSRVGDITYVETFNAINDTIRNPAFGIVFFGSIPAIIAAMALNWRRSPVAAKVLLVTGLVLYVSGMAVTFGGNLPLNDQLGAVGTLTDAVAATARADFEADWNRLNLIRSLMFAASFIAMAAVPTLMRRADRSTEGTSSGQTA